jgi:hypothetical protein
MALILRETDREPVGEVGKRNGIRDKTLYKWRAKDGGVAPSDLRRLRQRKEAKRKPSSQSSWATNSRARI